MEQKIIIKTRLYSKKKIILIWLIAGVIVGGFASIVPYLSGGEDFSWLALLIPIGVTGLTSPFVYKIYRRMHYFSLKQNNKLNQKRTSNEEVIKKYRQWLDSGIITQKEFESKVKEVVWF